MFILQLFLAFQDVVSIADDPESVGYELGPELTWADIPHSSEWLAGVNATRKWVEGVLEFTPGCTADGFWEVLIEVPKCSVWYLLLTGELRLREDPDFTVQTLELCLFALSGSVLLLIIRLVETKQNWNSTLPSTISSTLVHLKEIQCH